MTPPPLAGVKVFVRIPSCLARHSSSRRVQCHVYLNCSGCGGWEKEKCSDTSNQLRKWVDRVWTDGVIDEHVPPIRLHKDFALLGCTFTLVPLFTLDYPNIMMRSYLAARHTVLFFATHCSLWLVTWLVGLCSCLSMWQLPLASSAAFT